MTGTANEFYDCSDKLNNIDLFSAWLFGKINANCVLSDLSRYECSVLIPKNQSAPSGAFSLLIMSPEDSDQLHTVLKAEQSWQDKNYSSTHKKIGVKFQNLDFDQLLEINVLMQHVKLSGNANIKCGFTTVPVKLLSFALNHHGININRHQTDPRHELATTTCDTL